MKLFFKNLNETKIIMENMVSFKKENGAYIVKGFKGNEKVIAGKVIEMTNSKLVIEGTSVRETYRLAPLNF
ncbi:MAG: hypothetical protein WBG30_09870 [Psychrilyobacter sp.]|uniref:hypothetical protein n=1 Tax=Psychrilyobacter sp. TaxID=2586924 RepID=UPI003C767879